MALAQWFENLGGAFDAIRQAIVGHLPNLAGAFVLIVLGWFAATVLRAGSRRLVMRLSRLAPGRAFQRSLQTSGMERLISESTAGIVYLVVWLLFLAAATESLGLPVVSTLVSALVQYMPSVLAAVLIIALGVVLANVAQNAIIATAASTHVAHGPELGSAVRIPILLIAAVVAIDQIGINSTFLMVCIGIVLAATAGGLALGFGLGARATVSNLLAMRYVAQAYHVGQRVRVGQVDGRIVKIGTASVELDTPHGRALVPASQFNEVTSILVRENE
ncbi:MAG TPA: mechanosensitive ion channel domain-containing protein [Terriglobia bacterium]|nr:mechanosensitive ion channel domain-containing protein [Terriglobia bacterium]